MAKTTNPLEGLHLARITKCHTCRGGGMGTKIGPASGLAYPGTCPDCNGIGKVPTDYVPIARMIEKEIERALARDRVLTVGCEILERNRGRRAETGQSSPDNEALAEAIVAKLFAYHAGENTIVPRRLVMELQKDINGPGLDKVGVRERVLAVLDALDAKGGSTDAAE